MFYCVLIFKEQWQTSNNYFEKKKENDIKLQLKTFNKIPGLSAIPILNPIAVLQKKTNQKIH